MDPEVIAENHNSNSSQNFQSTPASNYANGDDGNEILGISKIGGMPSSSSGRPCSMSISDHLFYLLADSALPVGSFAYSSGLESFLSHYKLSHPSKPTASTHIALLDRFLLLSLQSMANSALPYALAAYRSPSRLADLDNDLDASTPCAVARRASRAQGTALLTLWRKSLSSAPLPANDNSREAARTLDSYVEEVSSIRYTHLAPIWAVLCCATGQSIDEMAYVFLLNHSRAVLGAALRTKESVIGQFHQYSVLGGAHPLSERKTLSDVIQECIKSVWQMAPEDAGQVVPIMDLWVGRHEILYTRVFNS